MAMRGEGSGGGLAFLRFATLTRSMNRAARYPGSCRDWEDSRSWPQPYTPVYRGQREPPMCRDWLLTLALKKGRATPKGTSGAKIALTTRFCLRISL